MPDKLPKVIIKHNLETSLKWSDNAPAGPIKNNIHKK